MLSKRSNSPIYNILPDTLSCLSKLVAEASLGVDPTLRHFDAPAFREVVKFLLGFIRTVWCC